MIEPLYQKFLQCSGVSTDTRKISQGNLFVALKGPNFDGNRYAQQALDAGALYVVVDDSSLNLGSRAIVVPDTLQALQQLAHHHRRQFQGPVLAITGSNGKTTTKELITRVLATQYKTHHTLGNLNNHIGVPLTLLALPLDTDIAIVEMGANHLGEIASYCTVAEPTHGIITNLGTAHLGEFGGRENLIRAKSELFDYLRKNKGKVFINQHDELLANMAHRFADPIPFPDTTHRLVSSSPYVVYTDSHNTHHTTNLVGEYNYMNLAAALAVGMHFGVNLEKAYAAIDSYAPDNNRSQILKRGTNTVILDAYNANPDSTLAALHNLTSFEQATKIALLGDMKELGEYSHTQHNKVYEAVAKQKQLKGFFVGEEYEDALRGKDAQTFASVDELIAYAKEHPFAHAAVLIKGSRSMAMEKLTQIEELWT